MISNRCSLTFVVGLVSSSNHCYTHASSFVSSMANLNSRRRHDSAVELSRVLVVGVIVNRPMRNKSCHCTFILDNRFFVIT